jgi:hypothetical protein
MGLENKEVLGTSHGGCTTKVPAVIDRKGRPLRFS